MTKPIYRHFKKKSTHRNTPEYFEVRESAWLSHELVKSNIKWLISQRGLSERAFFRLVNDAGIPINRTAFYKKSNERQSILNIFSLTIYAYFLSVPIWLLLVPDIEEQFEPFR